MTKKNRKILNQLLVSTLHNGKITCVESVLQFIKREKNPLSLALKCIIVVISIIFLQIKIFTQFHNPELRLELILSKKFLNSTTIL